MDSLRFNPLSPALRSEGSYMFKKREKRNMEYFIKQMLYVANLILKSNKCVMYVNLRFLSAVQIDVN